MPDVQSSSDGFLTKAVYLILGHGARRARIVDRLSYAWIVFIRGNNRQFQVCVRGQNLYLQSPRTGNRRLPVVWAHSATASIPAYGDDAYKKVCPSGPMDKNSLESVQT